MGGSQNEKSQREKIFKEKKAETKTMKFAKLLLTKPTSPISLAFSLLAISLFIPYIEKLGTAHINYNMLRIKRMEASKGSLICWDATLHQCAPKAKT